MNAPQIHYILGPGDKQSPVIWVTDKLAVPLTQRDDFSRWAPYVIPLSNQLSGLKIVTSIQTSLDGSPRAEGAAGSHSKGLSLDLAYLWDKSRMIPPDMRSRRLADNRAFLIELARAVRVAKTPFSVVAEGDHLHLDVSIPKGAYAYSTYRDAYKNDNLGLSCISTPIRDKLFSCLEDGTILPVSVVRKVYFNLPF
jgi:hypothetical protein